MRWAAVEAVARYQGGDPVAPAFVRIAKRRGVMIGRVAAARRLLSLVYHGLRDGEIRCLSREVGWRTVAGLVWRYGNRRLPDGPLPPHCAASGELNGLGFDGDPAHGSRGGRERTEQAAGSRRYVPAVRAIVSSDPSIATPP